MREISFFGVSLRYNGNGNAVSAQTERSGAAGPVRTVLGGYDLTGRLSSLSNRNLPAAAFSSQQCRRYTISGHDDYLCRRSIAENKR
jgi:hypothetical protein